MKVRSLLIATALVSSILGAVAAYLVLTVPNDIAADAILKSAHADVTSGKIDAGREKLTRVVQQYPRTNAAAAATVALVTLAHQQDETLARELASLKSANAAQQKQLAALGQQLQELANKPAPAPVVVQAPKPVHKKRVTTTHRHRRR